MGTVLHCCVSIVYNFVAVKKVGDTNKFICNGVIEYRRGGVSKGK
jgi:hypothetical protein